MSPSSIFNFDTLRISPRKLLVPLFCTLVFYLVIDRVIQVLQPVKLYGGWENPYVQMTIDGARRMKKQHGRVDVMLLGSSIGLHIDVGRWQEACGDKLVCYNAAMGGQHPEWARFIFENVFYPKIRPKQVIYVVCPRDLNGPSFAGEEARYNALLFKSVNARRILARTWSEKFVSVLERFSYLFQARRHIRRYLQSGPIRQDPVFPMLESGGNPPSVRHLLNENPASAEEKKAMERNPYADFQAPEDGELGELLGLAQFCKARGVEFVLVSQPAAPRTGGLYDNPDRDLEAFHVALDKVRSAGFEVVDMASALNLKNRDFSDNDHPNRWGGGRMTDYIYRNVIVPRNNEIALVPSLPEDVEIHFYNVVSRFDPGFYYQDRSRIPPSAVYACPLQIVTDSPGATISLSRPLPPGTYYFDLYGADERTTRTEGEEGHRLLYRVAGQESGSRDIRFTMSRRTVQGETLTRREVQLSTTSSVSLVVEGLAGDLCVLDSLFLRPRVVPGQVARLPTGIASADFATTASILVSNPSFEHRHLSRDGYPAEWEPYTRNQVPWGTVDLSDLARSGGHAVELAMDTPKRGWGCMVEQDVHPWIFSNMLGREVEVSVWVKCAGPKAGASLVLRTPEKRHPFPPYSDVGRWQKLALRVRLPDDLQRMTISVGSFSSTPALFDDVDMRVLADDSRTTASMKP